jgi:hypothetical protein
MKEFVGRFVSLLYEDIMWGGVFPLLGLLISFFGICERRYGWSKRNGLDSWFSLFADTSLVYLGFFVTPWLFVLHMSPSLTTSTHGFRGSPSTSIC